MRLHTQDYGTGPKRIALIHGVSGDQAIFHDLTDRLVARGYAVTGVDLRGHGESPRGTSYEVADFAGDLVDTLPTGLDLIAGHSLGAIALVAAVPRLQPVAAIYLDPAWFASADFDAVAMHANVGEHPDGRPFSLDELAAVNTRWGSANLRRARDSHTRWDASMLEAVTRATTDTSLTATPLLPPGPAAVPSLVVLGADSPVAAHFPTAQVVAQGYEVRVQAEAGHNLHLDDPDATVAALSGWL